MVQNSSNDKLVPVLLTFDIDGETLWTARDPKNAGRQVTVSQGSYGPKTGIPRILDLLDKYNIKATFFVPGLTAERYPERIRDIHARGHEISHHSYTHRWLDEMDEAEERRELEMGFEALQKVVGVRPKGYRSPAGEITANSLRLWVEYGLEYSSNFMDTDSPYRHVVDGKKTNLVEFPWAWCLDDAPYFLYSVRLMGRVLWPPSAALETWKAEFDGIYAEGGTFTLCMHPQLIGRSSRIAMLERFIQHVRTYPNAQFARCDEWADRIREQL